MIKAVIFDCFGVLVGKGFEYTYRVAGGDPVQDREFIDDLLGRANLGMIPEPEFHQTMAAHLGLSLDAWLQALHQAEQPDEELLQYIQGLRPHYKTAILSNANHGVIADKIGESRLRECFDAVVVSAEVGMVKPDQGIYEHAAERLDVTPGECVFIDDREIFVEAAKAAGMQAFLYRTYPEMVQQLERLLA